MADSTGAPVDGAPSAPVDISVVLMDDVIHKLHVLDYESEFCLAKDITPFSKIHFAIPMGNPAVQFGQFAALVGWLFAKLGRPLNIDRFEDPASSINKMLSELKSMGFDVDFPPVKLRQAYGEPVCRVLSFLVDAALSATGFRWIAPQFALQDADSAVGEEETYEDAEEESVDGEDGGRNGLLGGAGVQRRSQGAGAIDDEEDIIAEEGIEEEDTLVPAQPVGSRSQHRGSEAVDQPSGGTTGQTQAHLGLGQAQPQGSGAHHTTTGAASSILTSTIDPVVWKAEVERVAPRLKAAAAAAMAGGILAMQRYVGGAAQSSAGGAGAQAASTSEWRSHLETTQSSENTIATTLPTALKSLERLGGDLSELLDAVASREKYINSTFKALAQQYGAAAQEHKNVSAEATELQQRVSALSAELAVVSEHLEDVRGRMEERGSSMTDTSPLIKIKAALQALRAESAALDVQAGVVSHAVMQSRLSHTFMLGGAGPFGATGRADSEGEDEEEEVDWAGDGDTHTGGSKGVRGGRLGGSYENADEDGLEDSTAFRGLQQSTGAHKAGAAAGTLLNKVAGGVASAMKQGKGSYR